MTDQLARIEFEALWRDMDKSHEVPPEYLNRMSDLIDEYLSVSALAAAPASPSPVGVLTFDALRKANNERQEHWGGSDNWTLADWSNALAGEVGEACNIVKKIRRPQLGTKGNEANAPAYYDALETEIGDVLIYLDLLAKAAGRDLATCAMRAFNEKSEKLGMPVRLTTQKEAANG